MNSMGHWGFGDLLEVNGTPMSPFCCYHVGCTSTAACIRAIENNRNASIGDLFDYVKADELSDKFEREDVSSKQSFEIDADKDDRPNYFHNAKGFGLPGEPIIPRVLNEEISTPPYFYFENVASMPKDDWRNIQRHLYDITPEFVNALNFLPCRRPRGYIHNLPLEGRSDVLPRLPMTVQELLNAGAFWPTWDKRTKLSTINTRVATAFVQKNVMDGLAAYERKELSTEDMKTIMYWAKKWNLVWVKPQELRPLTPEELEICLGFDLGHTRVIFSTLDRVRVLGNSF